MKKYKYYIFDFDGTLADSKEAMVDFFTYGFNAIGESCTREEAYEYMHYNLEYTIKKRGITDKDKIDRFSKAIVESLSIKEFYLKTVLFAESKGVLQGLTDNGCHIYIMSGNSTYLIEDIVNSNGIASLIEGIYGNERYKKSKPAPDGIFQVLNDFNITDLAEACYVGDSLSDYECAVNAGIDGYLIDRFDEYPSFNGNKIKALTELCD